MGKKFPRKILPSSVGLFVNPSLLPDCLSPSLPPPFLFYLFFFLLIQLFYTKICARSSSLERSAVDYTSVSRIGLYKIIHAESPQFVIDYFFGNLTYFNRFYRLSKIYRNGHRYASCSSKLFIALSIEARHAVTPCRE